MDEKQAGQASVQIGPEGLLTVAVDLNQPNAEIIALGLLEKAKMGACLWIRRREALMSTAVQGAVMKEKSVLDRILRRNGT